MSTRTLRLRRTMTPNQVVAYNVTKARALRGWTQDQAAEALAPYLGAKLSGPSFSSLERSAWTINRIKQFSADDLLALSRGFDLPIGFFFTPPPPEADAGLYAPDAPIKGLDPIVLLDAILGTPDNLEHWERELLTYSASSAPAPKSKRERPSVSPSGLAERVTPLAAQRARALLRRSFGDITEARDVLERLTELIDTLDDTTPDGTANRTAPTGAKARRDTPAQADTANQATQRNTGGRRKAKPNGRAGRRGTS